MMRLARWPLYWSLLAACTSSPSRGPDPADHDSPPGDTTQVADEEVADADASDADDVGDADNPSCPTCVRSALYPDGWQPGYADASGRFLHDFSYAGYRGGEEPQVSSEALVLDVAADFDASRLGESDATAAIQQAIDAASAGGGVVYFPAGTYLVTGRLTVSASNVVLRGDGPTLSKLRFTKFTSMTGEAHLTFRGAQAFGSDVMLLTDAAPHAHELTVDDVSGFAVGDDVALGFLISDDFVAEHGMTGTWQEFNGTWQPFFWRTIVAIDAAANKVTFDVPVRYPAKTRDSASLRKVTGYLSEVGLESLGIANAVASDDAWSIDLVHAVSFEEVKDAWVSNVASFEPPGGGGKHLMSGGVEILRSKRLTIANTRLEKAQNRGSGGNGYLYELQQSGEVLIKDSIGSAGRHNFIQNWGFGTSGCVFLRCTSEEGRALTASWDPGLLPGYSEFHHSLAIANLIDGCTLDDGWYAGNRRTESSGAGHTSTQNVFWNTRGTGVITSLQFGWGYVIGPVGPSLITDVNLPQGEGTAPLDYVEEFAADAILEPASLYEDQRARRLSGSR